MPTQTKYVIGREILSGRYVFLANDNNQLKWVNNDHEHFFDVIVSYEYEDDAIELVQLGNEEDEDKKLAKLFSYANIFVAPMIVETISMIDVGDDVRHEVITERKEIV